MMRVISILMGQNPLKNVDNNVNKDQEWTNVTWSKSSYQSSNPQRSQPEEVQEDYLSRYYPASFEYVVQELFNQAIQVQKGLRSQIKVATIQEAFKLLDKERHLLPNINLPQIDQIVHQITYKQHNNQELLSLLVSLKRKLLIVDVYKLEKMVLKVNNSTAKVLGKDVILLLGPTGSGKTAIQHKFIGVKFRQSLEMRIKNYVPFDIPNEQEQFRLGSEALSCKSSINVAQVPHFMQNYIKKQNFHESLCIVDTPGFQDRRGIEVDIASLLGIVSILEKCNSVRIAVIVPVTDILITNSRPQGVIDIVKILAQLFYDLQIVKDSIKFYINKTSDVDIKTVNKTLNILIRYRQENKMTEEEIFLLKKLKKDAEHEINYICPITDDIELYKHKLKTIVKMPAINRQNAAYAFNWSISERSQQQIDHFWHSNSLKMKKLFQETQYMRAAHCFDEMKIFAKLMSNQILNEEDEDLYEPIFNSKSKHKRQITMLQDFINEQNYYQLLKLEDNLKMAEILTNYNDPLLQAKQNMRKISQSHQVFSSRVKKLKGIESMKSLQDQSRARLKKKFMTSDRQHIQGLAALMKGFSEMFQLPSLVNEAIEQTEIKLVSLMKRIQKDIFDNLFEMTKEQVNSLIVLSEVIKILKNDDMWIKRIETLRVRVDQILMGYIQDLRFKVDEEQINLRSINSLQKCMKKCEYLNSLQLFTQQHSYKKQILQITKKLKNKCKQKIQLLSESFLINDLDWLLNSKNHRDIQSANNEINQLMKINFIGQQLRNEYNECLEDIKCRFIETFLKFREDIEETYYFDGINHQNFDASIDQMKQGLTYLAMVSKIVQLDLQTDQQSRKFIDSIKGMILRYFESIEQVKISQYNVKNCLMKIKLFLKNLKKLKKIARKHSFLKNLQQKQKQNLDIKISLPLQEFINHSYKKLESRGFSFFLCMDQLLENLVVFMAEIEQQMYPLQFKQYSQTNKHFQQFIKKQILDKLTIRVTEFTQQPQINISGQFMTVVQILKRLRSRLGLLVYLSNLNFSVEEQINDILITLEDNLVMIQDKNKDVQNDVLEIKLEKVKYLRVIQLHLSTQKRFVEQQLDLKEQIKVINQKERQSIEIIFQRQFDVFELFLELKPYIQSLDLIESYENKKHMSFIFKQLELLSIKILAKLRKSQSVKRNIFFEQEEFIPSAVAYIQNLKSALIFNQEMKVIELKDNRQRDRCLTRFPNDFINESMKIGKEMLLEERRILLDCIYYQNLVGLRKRSQIISQLEDCFECIQRKDSELLDVQIQTKRKFMGLFDEKLNEEEEQLLISEKQLSQIRIISVLKNIYHKINKRLSRRITRSRSSSVTSCF